MGAERVKRQPRRLPRHETPPVCRKLGKVVRRERQQRGWSQDTFAEKTGLTQGEISLIEHALCFPSVETAERLASGFGYELSGLIILVERSR